MKTDLFPLLLDDFFDRAEEVSSDGGVEFGESDVSLDRSRTDEEGLDVSDELERKRETTLVGPGKGYKEQKGPLGQPGPLKLSKGAEMDEPSRRRRSAFSLRIVCFRTPRSCQHKQGLHQLTTNLATKSLVYSLLLSFFNEGFRSSGPTRYGRAPFFQELVGRLFPSPVRQQNMLQIARQSLERNQLGSISPSRS